MGFDIFSTLAFNMPGLASFVVTLLGLLSVLIVKKVMGIVVGEYRSKLFRVDRLSKNKFEDFLIDLLFRNGYKIKVNGQVEIEKHGIRKWLLPAKNGVLSKIDMEIIEKFEKNSEKRKVDEILVVSNKMMAGNLRKKLSLVNKLEIWQRNELKEMVFRVHKRLT